jgi:hypothetical protein
MKYTKKKYKYQLTEVEVFQTSFRPRVAIYTRFASMTTGGLLTIRAGYAWDGVSGPIRDTDSNHHAGLCHDALYQLMRMGLLDREMWRQADVEFARICLQYGTSKAWVFIYMTGLKYAAGKYADPKERAKIYDIGTIRVV